MKTGTKDILGSTMTVDTDQVTLANKIIEDLKEKRVNSGWNCSNN